MEKKSTNSRSLGAAKEPKKNPTSELLNKKQNGKPDVKATHQKNLVIDIAALLVYLVVANPSITGIGVHEWLGMAIFLVILVHSVLHYDWIIDVIKSREKKSTPSRQGNLVLDVLLMVTFMIVSVSGIGISGEVLPRLGFYIDGYYFWGPLHSISAKVFLAVLVIHLVVHWKWIFALLKKDRGNNDE